MDEYQLTKSIIHSHCENCIKINKCSVRPQLGESCEIVSCNVECGARFHKCKAQEHKLLCMNEKVPCINAVNGCPLWMPRRQKGCHLETCPASVVHCTMEWNRWPVCSRERQLHIPFHQPNPHVRPGQLDVALALRDQRMLNEWIQAPRKAWRVMRSGMMRRFPAVPPHCHESQEPANSNIQNQSSGAMGYDEDTWDNRKAPPGLKRSVCSELYRASKQTTDSLSMALNIITNYSKLAETKLDVKAVHPFPMEEDKENCNGVANGWSADARAHILKDTVDAMDMELDAFENLGNEIAGSEKMDLGIEMSEIVEPINSFNVLFVDSTIVSEISSASMTDHARKQPIAIPPQPPSPPMFVNLGLDLTLESITRYQSKPKSMYTFLCAQEFRRDEYSWHYQNVHSDIHGGLNGWLEQRCPLAHYGCMFSVKRFFPTSPGYSIVHNDILESFGVKPLASNTTSSKQSSSNQKVSNTLSYLTTKNSVPIKHHGKSSIQNESPLQNDSNAPPITSLCQLPFEVLQHVMRFLDSFSICNLAMTSHMMREVCCSMLEERGIVVQQWERHWNGSRGLWRIAYRRWFFSNAFTPVEWWGFEDKENMANHLQKCVYFQRNIKTDPYYYPMQSEPNQSLFEKLKSSAKQNVAHIAENQATKL